VTVRSQIAVHPNALSAAYNFTFISGPTACAPTRVCPLPQIHRVDKSSHSLPIVKMRCYWGLPLRSILSNYCFRFDIAVTEFATSILPVCSHCGSKSKKNRMFNV